MRIIDTHLHLVEPSLFSYAWIDNEPKLQDRFSLARYEAEALPLGVEAMLHMEVDVVEADMRRETEWVSGLGGRVIGAIAACRPESPDFPAHLETLAANPKVRGLRRCLHVVPDETSQTPLFIDNIRRLAAHGLSFDIVMLARQLPLALKLVDQCPDVTFVIDHCGVPDVKAKALDPWRADMTALARRPNVRAKVSGVVAYAGEAWTVEDIRPFVEHTISAFGWDRVVWGSDWPVCTLTANLTRWIEATHHIIAGASEEEKRKLLSENAKRVYRLNR